MDVTIKNAQGNLVFKDIDQVSKDEYIGDVGPKTIEMLRDVANKSKFILWNGPLGNFEIGFNDKTEQLAEIIANVSAPTLALQGRGADPEGVGSETIVGGGDTLAAIQKLNLLEKFSFVSTAGGAMLDFLANETLPGIEALT
jgi:phosphoglycerate kinase